MATGTIKAPSKLSISTIVANTTISSDGSTATDTVNTYNGAKLSDYDIICINLKAFDADIRNNVTIPRVIFTNGNKVTVYAPHGASLEHNSGITVQYKNDTSVYATRVGDKLIGILSIDGIKLNN